MTIPGIMFPQKQKKQTPQRSAAEEKAAAWAAGTYLLPGLLTASCLSKQNPKQPEKDDHIQRHKNHPEDQVSYHRRRRRAVVRRMLLGGMAVMGRAGSRPFIVLRMLRCAHISPCLFNNNISI
jgi:hypothetical protein